MTVPVRSIFLSDSHLGQKLSRGDELLAFLKEFQPDHLYLVGDFVDAWCLRWNWHWPASYTGIIDRLIELQSRGTVIRYTPGNHDSFLRRRIPKISGVAIADDFIHETVDRRRLLVVHGDLFDSIERNWKWLSRVGSFLFNRVIDVNLGLNFVLRKFHRRPVYFSFWIKRTSKRMLGAFGRFQRKLIKAARDRGVDGIICGHVHFPQMRHEGSVVYINTGDWLENASALVEQFDGSLELINHGKTIASLPAQTPSPNSAAPNQPNARGSNRDVVPTASSLEKT